MANQLSSVHNSLTQDPRILSIAIPHPNYKQRLYYIKDNLTNHHQKNDLTTDAITKHSAGLSLLNIRGMLSYAKENNRTLTVDYISSFKKERIEAEAFGLLEFIQTPYNLDNVAGHNAIKQRLKVAAKAIKGGHHDVLPMGYLICGPVGCGKTFLVSCFANEVDIPMVRLKNFRSQWQGVTEGNLEKILTILTALSPIIIMIDEADAYLGDRKTSGDSGVSTRVFSQIVSFMGNTQYRGKIIWFLMTARPDLMPVDLKRQGRAEEHLALFPPMTKQERIDLFQAMMKKTNISPIINSIPSVIEKGTKNLSGADMEAILTRAKMMAFQLQTKKSIT